MVANRSEKLHPQFLTPPLSEDSREWQKLAAELSQNDLARIVNEVVDRFDPTKLLESTYHGVGSLAYPPVLMLKIVIYEILIGRLSPQNWAHDAATNSRVKYLGRGIKPSRATCFRFRDRMGLVIEEVFSSLIQLCRQDQILEGKICAIDGTTIPAIASRHRVVNQKTLDKRIQQLNDVSNTDQDSPVTATPLNPSIDQVTPAATKNEEASAGSMNQVPAPALKEETASTGSVVETNPSSPSVAGCPQPPAPPTLPSWMAKTPRGRRKQLQKMKEARKVLERRIEQNAKKPKDRRRPVEQIQVSPSEPEAPLGRDKLDVYRPFYTVQFLVDVKTLLVLGYAVFAQATDTGTLPQTIDISQRISRGTIELVLADAAYLNLLDIQASKARNINLLGPVQESSLTAGKKDRSGKPGNNRDEFQWLPEEGTYKCPNGHLLKKKGSCRKPRRDDQFVTERRFYCPPDKCQGCPLADGCVTNPSKGRTIKRLDGQELLDEAREKMKQLENKELYRLRSSTVELSFADVKNNRKMNRLHGRGLPRAITEIGLVLLAQNVLRSWNLRNSHPNPMICGGSK